MTFESLVRRTGPAKPEPDMKEWFARIERQEDTSGSDRGIARLDARGARVLALVLVEARRLDHGYIGTEHILLGLARLRGGSAAELLRTHGLTSPKLRAALLRVTPAGTSRPREVALTPRTQRVLGLAEGLALAGGRRTSPDDALLAPIEEGEGIAVGLMRALGADPRSLAIALRTA